MACNALMTFVRPTLVQSGRAIQPAPDAVVNSGMPDARFCRDQADRFDRVADECAVPELVAYYRQLAKDYRARVEEDAGELPQGKPRPIGQDD